MVASSFEVVALHPIAPPPPHPSYEPSSGDRYFTQLSGQLYALSALPSEKDTPGSYCIESGSHARCERFGDEQFLHPARDRSPLDP